MKMIVLIVITVTIVAVAAYYFLFPKNSFHIVELQSGATITFSKTGISFESAPDHYSAQGIEQIDSYVPELLAPSQKVKYLHMFTPDGERGFGLSVRNGIVEASLRAPRLISSAAAIGVINAAAVSLCHAASSSSGLSSPVSPPY